MGGRRPGNFSAAVMGNLFHVYGEDGEMNANGVNGKR
jgi:hypothetical protein